MKTELQRKAYNALTDYITEAQVSVRQARERGRAVPRLLVLDIEDALSIRNRFELELLTFHEVVAEVVDLETMPRDAILDKFDAVGLRDAVEATGLITYLQPKKVG